MWFYGESYSKMKQTFRRHHNLSTINQGGIFIAFININLNLDPFLSKKKFFDIFPWLVDNIPRHNTFWGRCLFWKESFLSVDGITFKIIYLFLTRVFPLSIKKIPQNDSIFRHLVTWHRILFTLAYSFMSLCVKE